MKKWWPWLVLAALPRVLAFFLTENVYGDAVVRTWLGYMWVQSPHVIASFDQGGYQFGPLHLYLIGLATLLPWPMADSGRLVSLLTGVLTAWPLLALTANLFGARAAKLTGVAFAFWGLHIQFSTTASGEALNLLLVLACLCWFERWFVTQQRVWLLASALVLNLACAARYDSWLFVPLLTIAVWWPKRSVRDAALFGACSMAFAAPWMFGNLIDRGSPLYPFIYIDEFHRQWYPSEQAIWGTSYKWITLFFWPGAALVTLTPLVAVFAAVGCRRAWRAMPATRWLIVLILLPTALYTLRSTVLSSFVPLARFTAKEVALLLPFVGVGAQTLLDRLNPRISRAILVVTVFCAVAWPSWLGWFTFRTRGSLQSTLRAISPVTTNTVELVQVAKWLSARANDGSVLIVDSDPRGYDDLQLGFYSGFPFERLARLRSPLFERRLSDGPARWLVRFEGGGLDTSGQFAAGVFRGMSFSEVGTFAAPVHVYEKQ